MSLSRWMVRNVTYPMHERIRGRQTLREFRALQELSSLSPKALRQIVETRVHDLLVFASARLPYYRDLVNRCKVDFHADSLLEELARLPVLQKPDVRANAERMVCRDVAGGARPHSSGGTTGDTLRFFIDGVRQAQDLAARLFMQSLFGVEPGDRRLHVWGSPIETRGWRLKRWRDRMINEAIINAFEMSPTQMDAHIERIRQFKPRVIYGYPTSLALLAAHARHHLTPEHVPWLRLVVMTGEEVTDDQRRVVHETFGVPVAAEYGSREVGLIAHECPRGNLHIVWPHIHVEIASAGQLCPIGRPGDVLCTTLNTRAQPFIRYRLGDVGRLLEDACECGLPFPLMQLEGGKITGFVALEGGRLCHGAVTSHMLRGERGIVEYKTHQTALNEFMVYLVVDETFDAQTPERIRQRYRTLFGPHVNVACRLVDRIPPDPSGKRRYVVSDVAPNYASFEVVDTPAEVSCEHAEEAPVTSE